jgi:hypothetical protein
VTYFEDGTSYPFLPPEDHAICAGWLDARREYSRGPVPPEFVAVLSRLCRDTVFRTRGFHYCDLCVPDHERRSDSDYVKTVVHDDRGEFAVGSAEIHVQRLGEAMYVTPDMVIHYVVDHGYRPPDGFVEAVLAST